MAATPCENLRELWLRECLRVSREGANFDIGPMLDKLSGTTEFDWTDAPFQTALVERVLHDRHQATYPPNQFRAADFWCKVIGRMRAKLQPDVELHPELLAREEAATRTMQESVPENMTAGWYRTFELADTADETTTSTLDGPTQSVVVLPTCAADRARCYPFRVETGCMAASIGLVMWPAGFLLSEYALDNPSIFRGKRILELGAGIGLTSAIVAKFTQPSAIIATDFCPRALENIHQNFKTNGLASKDAAFSCSTSSDGAAADVYTSSSVAQLTDMTSDETTPCSVHTALVDWCSYSPSQLAAFEADVVIAADVTYLEQILVPFAQTVRACLQANPRAIVLLAQAERHPTTFMLYLDAIRDEGLTLKELPTGDLHQRFNYDRTTCPVALHQVTFA